MSKSLENWLEYLGNLRVWIEKYEGEDMGDDGLDSAFAAIVQNAKKELPLVEAYITAIRATEEENVSH